MATNANFRVAGTAVYNGTFKPHFSNHEIEARSRVLTRNGFSEVKFIRLPRRMSKPAAVAYLIETRPDLFSKRELDLLAKRIEGTRYHKTIVAKMQEAAPETSQAAPKKRAAVSKRPKAEQDA